MQVAIEPDETLICGGWKLVEGRMVPDDSLIRIRTLVETELDKIGSASDGWSTLFKDRSDGRLWELFYPHSEMQSGGPESLRCVDTVQAAHKYFGGMTTNERLYFAGLMPEWDSAARSRDREGMVYILGRVGLASQADQIAESVLANPKRYGF